MRTLGQDYETYYGKATGDDGKHLNLSLRNPKLGMSEYIRHPEFEVHGVSLRWADERTGTFYPADEIAGAYDHIRQTHGWDNVRVVAHNALFEGFINYEKYNVVPGSYFCTLAMAEHIFQGAFGVSLGNLAKVLLGKDKLAGLDNLKHVHTADLTIEQWQWLHEYANNDVDLSLELFEKYAGQLPMDEQKLMSHTIMLFADPVLEVDIPLATEALAEAVAETAALVKQSGYTEAQISGNKSFAAILENHLGHKPPQKISKTTKKLTNAFAKTDREFVALKAHEDESVRDVVLARLGVKSNLKVRRTERLIKYGTTGSKRLPICLHYCRPHTLRWSGGDKLNPQNFLQGSKMRRSIKAPPGYVLCVVDSSQVEARWLAWIAGQESLLELFRTGQDPYNALAVNIYGGGPYGKDTEERYVGKTAQLGLGYYMGAKNFQNVMVTGARGPALPISLNFAYNVVNTYRKVNSDIVQFWETCEGFLDHMVNGKGISEHYIDGFDHPLLKICADTNRVIFPNGLYLRYPNLCNEEGDYMYSQQKGPKTVWNKIYGGALCENITQSGSRHSMAPQILKIAERYRTVLLVHDESVYAVPEAEADEAMAFGIKCFREVQWWTPGLPLDAEGGYDTCYSK
jgi:DNA polymerase